MNAKQRENTPRKKLRWSAALFLLGFLLGSLLPSLNKKAQAAPHQAVALGDVVISEFRTSSSDSGYDEFVELFNRSNETISITSWQIKKSSTCGEASIIPLVTIDTGVSLAPGQYYLVGKKPEYTGTVDQEYTSSSSVADEGGIALLDDLGTIIDQVGMCATTTYLEGDPLPPFSGTSEQSYQRKDNGCTDTGDNDADFILQTSADPQNSSDPPIKCLRVTKVTSAASGTYIEGQNIDITVEFSTNVNVTGFPTLLLETGIKDRTAIYSSGNGGTTLTFNYIVQDGDVSDHLNYVATNSLSLKGGTIVGAVGDADLTLPELASSDSLGGSTNIEIDNQSAPSVISFARQVPLESITNKDKLIFRATFNELVTNVDALDFSLTGTTAGVSSVVSVGSSVSVYDVTASGGDLAGLNGTVGLDLSGVQDIIDIKGTGLLDGEPTADEDETYTVDNAPPTIITFDLATGQDSSTGETPINFTVVFSEEIDPGTFTVVDAISPSTTVTPASSITWSITDSGDHKEFTLSADRIVANTDVTIIPSIDAWQVKDLAGNKESSGETADAVIFKGGDSPTLTINQASGQSDPASSLPIDFTVIFSEPIIASIFTTYDITQSGTATGIIWRITNSGDDQNFTLSATGVTGVGTLIPSIAANRVTDLVGNNNLASASTDNTVIYRLLPSTKVPIPPTRTPTPYPFQSVVLNEVLPRPGHDWNGDGVVDTNDEFIEIINRGKFPVNLKGWKLDDEYNSGSEPYTLPSVTLKAGGRIAIFGYTSHISLSDGGDTVRLLKSNNKISDVITYTVVKGADQSWCRFPENGFWNPKCFPTPNEENDLRGKLSDNPTAPVRYACLVPDTAPEIITLIECGSLGMEISNASFWNQDVSAVWLTGYAKSSTWFR